MMTYLFYRQYRSKRSSKIILFGAEPLNIFTTDEENKKGPPAESVIWDFLQRRDIKLSVTHPPANIYEQLILWTEQGKIWKFPIDNEQGTSAILRKVNKLFINIPLYLLYLLC